MNFTNSRQNYGQIKVPFNLHFSWKLEVYNVLFVLMFKSISIVKEGIFMIALKSF